MLLPHKAKHLEGFDDSDVPSDGPVGRLRVGHAEGRQHEGWRLWAKRARYSSRTWALLACAAVLVLYCYHASLKGAFLRWRAEAALQGMHRCAMFPFDKTVDAAAPSVFGQRALVTGGAGFIGSHVAEFLITRLRLEVVVADDLSGGSMQNVPKGATFFKVDLSDPLNVARVFREHGPFVFVFHLAANAAEGLSHFTRVRSYSANLLASAALVNAAINQRPMVRRFVFTSSIAAYGSAESASDLPLREGSPQRPEDPYAIAKHAVELDLRAAHALFGLNYTVIRPHNVYGPRQSLRDPHRNAVALFMRALAAGSPASIFGSGQQLRAFSYIDDVAPLIAASVLFPGAANEDFFVGSDEPVSVLELSELVASALGLPHRVQHLPARQEVQEAYASHAKASCVFRPPEPVRLRAGLHRMWTAEGPAVRALSAAARSAKADAVPVEAEITLNLPPSWAAGLVRSRASSAIPVP